MSDMLEEINSALFGDGIEIAKFEPDPADISPWRKGKYKLSPKQRKQQSYKNFKGKKKNDTNQRALTAGLSAVGAAAGAAGLGYAAHKTGGAYRAAKAVKGATRGSAFKTAVKKEPFGSALVPLEVAGLGGEILATKILHGDVKHKKKIAKRKFNYADLANVTVGSVGAGAGVIGLRQNKKQNKEIKAAQRTATRAKFVATETGKAVITTPPTSAGKVKMAAAQGAYKGYKKPISKARRPRKSGFLKNVKTAAANANTASAHGARAAYHGEKAAQDFATVTRRVRRATGPAGAVAATGIAGAGYYAGTKHNKLKGKLRRVKSNVKKIELVGELSKMDDDKRQVFGWASVTKIDGQDVLDKQGDYIAIDEVEKAAYHYVHHSRKGGDMHKRDGEVPLQVSDMVESFVITPEKLERLGLEPDALPHGWWVGYQINDDAVWQDVKAGKKLGFSIHGKGVRTPMETA